MEKTMDKFENFEQNTAKLAELGLDFTMGANGQILVIKRQVMRGVSETLYKWTGEQPQAGRHLGSTH
jgi:hypothetical protein